MIEENTEYLWVYGTLKSTHSHPMQLKLRQYAHFVHTGIYQGKLYRIDWYPALVPSDHPSDVVHGEVYQIQNRQLLFQALDQYEGYSGSDLENSEYIRKIESVKTEDGCSLNCWMYVYNRSVDSYPVIQSGVF